MGAVGPQRQDGGHPRLAGHPEQPLPQLRVQLRPGRDQDPGSRPADQLGDPLAGLSAGLTGAAIPAACAARVAAYSIEVLTLAASPRQPRRTPRAVSALAICVTVPASSA